MTAPTILQVMQGIETRLKTISGLRTAYFVADQINPPFAFVQVPAVPDYRISFRSGQMLIEPEVYVLVSRALDNVGQAALASYADPNSATSIKQAIEGDMTLGGVVAQCIVKSFRPLGDEEVGALQFYGGVFTLYVVADGS